MSVYVIICADPGTAGDVWVHGVYESHATAKRVFQRLSDETYYTVRLTKARTRSAR